MLLTNFIGPPGLLLHYLTCALFYPNKGFIPLPDVITAPATDAADASQRQGGNGNGKGGKKGVFSAPNLVRDLFPLVTTDAGARAVAAACAADVVWEYVNEEGTRVGRDAVAAMLTARARALSDKVRCRVMDPPGSPM